MISKHQIIDLLILDYDLCDDDSIEFGIRNTIYVIEIISSTLEDSIVASVDSF